MQERESNASFQSELRDMDSKPDEHRLLTHNDYSVIVFVQLVPLRGRKMPRAVISEPQKARAQFNPCLSALLTTVCTIIIT